MNESNTLQLPVSNATVEFIPFVTGAILLDISKQADINKYLIEKMITKITMKDAEASVENIYDAVRGLHGRDFKAIDKKLQAMLEEAQDPEAVKK
jgi:hypothetical protein